jgi:photosystem II stability/assembly factor-like uncharacterized protein
MKRWLAARGAIWIAVVAWAAPAQLQDYAPASPAVDYELDETVEQRPPVRRSPRHFGDISAGLPESIFTAVAVDPGDGEVFLAGADGAVFKTDDAGESWRPVLTFARGLAAISTDGGQIDPLGRSAVADRDDSLESIRELDDPADEARGEFELREDIAAFEDALDDFARGPRGPRDPVDEPDNPDDLPDGDADVAAIPFPHQAPGVRRIHFAAAESRLIYVATPQGLYVSRDTGESFSRLELPGGPFSNDIRDVATDPNERGRVYVATAGGMLIGDGKRFRRAPGRIGYQGALAVVARDRGGSTVVVVGTERGAFRSTDGGKVFRDLLLKGQSAFVPVGVVEYDARTRITYAGTANGLFAGERGAAILEARQSLYGRLVTAISVDLKRLRGVAVGVRGRGIIESENTGLDIVSMPEQLPAQHVLDIARSPSDSDGYLLATERGVFRHLKGTGIKVALDKLRALRREIKKEPTVMETMERAMRYARVDLRVVHGLMTRARIAPLLPRVRTAFRFATSDKLAIDEEEIQDFLDDDFDDQDVSDLDPSVIEAITDQLNLESVNDPRGYELWLVAEWDLDAVILNNQEIAAARRRPESARAEQRIAGRVRTLFVARRRLMAERVLADEKPDTEKATRDTLRLAELTSLLDAVTGGWFSDEARRRGASLEELSYDGVADRPRRLREGEGT